MPEALATQFVADPMVDPLILALMFAAFLVGAIGPFVLCVVGSVRDERAMRRYAAQNRSLSVANPVDPTIVPAVILPELTTEAEIATPANDHPKVPAARQDVG